MRALVYRGPDALAVEDRSVPDVGSGEALVRVDACGICGTDLRIASGRHRAYPDGTVRIPGHEIVGTVESVGDGVVGLSQGQRVFVAPNVGCGECDQCAAARPNLCRTAEGLGITRDGAFASYVLAGSDVVAAGNLMPVPSDLDPAALTLVEPLACALRGQRPCRIGPDDVVLIVGAGPIGVLHLLAAHASQARAVVVSEPSPDRREQAGSLGADRVVDPTSESLADALAYARGEGTGADVIIVAAPVPALQAEALELAAPGARINFFAGLPREGSKVELDTNLVHYKELVLTGTTACTTADCREALDLVLSGAVRTDSLVSERYELERATDAFGAARSGTALKVVIEP